jgi:hypothetical protein
MREREKKEKRERRKKVPHSLNFPLVQHDGVAPPTLMRLVNTRRKVARTTVASEQTTRLTPMWRHAIGWHVPTDAIKNSQI